MGYSLYLRSGEQPAAELIQAVAAASDAPAPAERWVLTSGGARIQAQVYADAGVPRGVDLEVPYGVSEGELRDVLALAWRLTQAAGAVVFDPQLGRAVTPSDLEEAVGRWRQAQAFAVDVLGEPDDPRGVVAPAATPPPLVSGGAKVLLWVLGGGILLALALEAIVGALAIE